MILKDLFHFWRKRYHPIRPMKIALDVFAPAVLIEVLALLGHPLMVAQHGEKDEDFFIRSNDFDPEIYVSPDIDWARFAMLRRRRIFRVKQGLPHGATILQLLVFLGHLEEPRIKRAIVKARAPEERP